jgi:small subunit ribosomal protein S6
MRNYELMILFDPNLQDEEKKALLDKIRQTITTNKGNIIKINEWGRRKLAYEINKFQEAFYVLIDLELEPDNIANLESSIRFEEKILRYLLVLSSNKVLKPQSEQPQEKQ